jgi:hypothetical protein
MSSTMKIILKIASIFVIIHKEFLLVPSLLLTFNMFKCETVIVSDYLGTDG